MFTPIEFRGEAAAYNASDATDGRRLPNQAKRKTPILVG
jgi:hypothetical protein